MILRVRRNFLKLLRSPTCASREWSSFEALHQSRSHAAFDAGGWVWHESYGFLHGLYGEGWVEVVFGKVGVACSETREGDDACWGEVMAMTPECI